MAPTPRDHIRCDLLLCTDCGHPPYGNAIRRLEQNDIVRWRAGACAEAAKAKVVTRFRSEEEKRSMRSSKARERIKVRAAHDSYVTTVAPGFGGLFSRHANGGRSSAVRVFASR